MAVRSVGLLWPAVALVATAANLLLARATSDSEAKFGGHVLALVVLL
jgi:hypothetical protein